MIQLRLFGGVSVDGDEGPLTGRSAQRRRIALLALLATGARSRDKVVGLLWPERDPDRARRSLSEALYVLRKDLGDGVIVAEGDDLRLDPDQVRTDIARFREALDRGDLEAAVDAYGGPFLDGFYVDDALDFERWTDTERERYEREYTQSLLTLAERAAAEGDADACVRWWRALRRTDPLSARYTVGLMRALEAAGHRAGALQLADDHANLMRDELDAEPDPDVEALAARMRAAPAGATVRPTAPARPGAADRDRATTAGASASGPSAAAPGAGPDGPGPGRSPSRTADRGGPPQDPTVSGTAEAGRRSGRRGLMAAGVAIGAVAAVVAAMALLSPPQAEPDPGIGTAEARAVAVLPFEVRGGPEYAYLAEGMVNLLATNLDGTGPVRSIDPHGLLAYLDAAEPAPDAGPRGPRVARHFGAELYVLGDVVEAGDRLRLSAALYEAGTGADPEPLVRASAEGPAAALFELVDDLTAQLLVELAAGDPRLVRLAGHTTASLPALKAYLAGERAFREARYGDAETAFERAVAADGQFALAHYRLSAAAEWNFDFVRARAAARQALRFNERLSDNDRRLLEAWHALLHGEAERAERLYNALVTRRPADVEAWAGLGEVLVHYNPVRGRPAAEAVPAFRRVLELDPEYGEARFHMLELAAARRDGALFDSLYAALDPASEQGLAWRAVRAFGWGTAAERDGAVRALREAEALTTGIAIGRLSAHLRDWDAALRLARELTRPERPSDWRAAGHLLTAQLEAARGRPAAARAALDEAASTQTGWARELDGLFAALPWHRTDSTRLAAVRGDLEAFDPEREQPNASFFFAAHNGIHAQLRHYLLGLLDVRLGAPDAAERHARTLEGLGRSSETREVGAALADAVRAHAAAARGEPATALGLLDEARLGSPLELVALSPFHSQALERFTRAELLAELGRPDEALAWYGSLTDGYDILFAAVAHLRQAELYDDAGEREAAARHYGRFLELWAEPEPGLAPMARRARARLAALASGDG